MDDPITRRTMVALMARWNISYYEKQDHLAVAKAAQEKADSSAAVVDQCKATCKALGFDRDDKENWALALQLFGQEASELYNQARDPSWPPWHFTRPPLVLEGEVTEIAAIAAPQGSSEGAASSENEAILERPPVKKIALDRLKIAGEEGSKASEIRDYIQKTYGGEIHEKTVGMTLYRLLKEGKVRRDKHTWFIAPEAMNPGVGTPGSDSSQDKRKED